MAREIKQMLEVSDGYWGFVNKRRFFRFCYAALTFFAIFAVVSAFYQLGQGSTKTTKSKIASKLASTKADDDARMLQYIYIFYPTPLVFAWFVVYFGKFLFCWKIKRLRRSHHYKYNLLIASLIAAAIYATFLWGFLKLSVQSGPKMREAIIIAFCELSLIGVQVYEEEEIRRERHAKKKLLREQQTVMAGFQEKENELLKDMQSPTPPVLEVV